MKLYAIMLLVALPLLWGCSQSQESKAQQLIKTHLKETLNDYGSYSSVSYSKLDSVKTKWRLPEELREDYKKQMEAVDKINASGYNNITIDWDASSEVKELDEIIKYRNEKNDPDKETTKKMENWKQLWTDFKHYQDIIKDSEARFVPQFAGWKMTHTYRAKNMYNATILVTQEFTFDKELTQITDIQDN